MKFSEALHPASADFAVQFGEQRLQHQSTAHPDAAMNPGVRNMDAIFAQRFLPGQDVLVVAVQKRAVQIKEDGGPARRLVIRHIGGSRRLRELRVFLFGRFYDGIERRLTRSFAP